MIFELKFSFYNDCSNHFGFLIEQILKNENCEYSIFVDDGLCLWIKDEKIDVLEDLIQKLSDLVPQSLFIREITSRALDEGDLPLSASFAPSLLYSYCPTCIQTPDGERCPVCQKTIPQTPDVAKMTLLLKNGESICIKSESGSHTLSLTPSQRVYCVDIANVLEVCDLTPKELQALASYEKPILKVRASREFAQKINHDEIYLSMAHDLSLLKLFVYLKSEGIRFLYAGERSEHSFSIAPMVCEPKEILILENDSPLILADHSPDEKLLEIFAKYSKRDKAFLSTILEENKIKDRNILNFYFSLDGGDKVSLYNSQTQWFNEVMEFAFPKDLFELFDLISQDGENGQKLLENYQAVFPHLCNFNHSFSSLSLGILGIWEIARIVLGIEKPFLSLARENLTNRGVAIDYSFTQGALISQKFELVKCIRSGMSFKLAGVDEGIIALGYIESFSLLPSKLYLAIRRLIQIDGISLGGDLFSSKMLGDFFYKNNRQTPIYRNISFPLLYR